MVLQNNSNLASIQTAAVIKRMLIGAVIAFAFMALFISGAKTSPSWGEYWRIRPLVCAALGGGLFFYLANYFLGHEGGWKKVAGLIIGVIGFLVAVFFAGVLGWMAPCGINHKRTNNRIYSFN